MPAIYSSMKLMSFRVKQRDISDQPLVHLVCQVWALLILSGCNAFGDEESNARISSRGVDGADFGDSVSEVQSKLGTYDSWGFSDGVRAWRAYYYFEGPHDGMRLYFIEVLGLDENGDSAMVAGPLDFVTVHDRYDGRTAKDIGVGSSRDEVVRAYGEPHDVLGSYHFYCLGDRELNITIRQDTVNALHVGYHVYPIELPTYCNN